MNTNDEKQLRLLSRLHYVAATLAAMIPLFGAAYGAVGVAILLGKMPNMLTATNRTFGWMPIGMGVFILLIGLAAVGANLLTASSLRSRTRHTLCMLTSAMNCVHFPLGTALGVVSLVVLCRPAVRAAFQSLSAVPQPPRHGKGQAKPGASPFPSAPERG